MIYMFSLIFNRERQWFLCFSPIVAPYQLYRWIRYWFISIVSSHLIPTSSMWSLSFQFLKTSCKHFSYPTHMPHVSHPSPSPWYDHPNNVFSTNHEALLQPPVTSSLFCPDTLIFLSTLLLNTASLWSSPAVRDQVSHSYRHQVVYQLQLHHTQFWLVRAVSTLNEHALNNT